MRVNNQQSASASLKHSLQALFLNHPAAVGESYFEHQRVAVAFAGSLALTAAAALLHALVPGLCQHTARDRIETLNKQLQSRSAGLKADKSGS